MQAQRRTLMFLLALTALAAAALALLTCTARRQEAAGREEEAGAIPLSAFAAKELTALTYTRAGQTVSLLYDGGAWAVAGDPDYRLDATKCDAMAAALADLRAIRRLDGAAGEDYGLAEPSLTVTVTAAGRTDTFTFGDTNPVTGDIYLQKAGDDAVYTAAPARADCFGYSLEELFEPFNPAGITARLPSL